MTSRSAVVLEVELLVRGRPTRSWSSEAGEITVGSGEGMILRAGGQDLAPHHATIHVEGNQVIAVAEGAAVLLRNDEPVSVAVVQPTDLLRIGPLTLRARLRPLHRPAESPRHATEPSAAEGVRLCVRAPGGRVRTVTIPDGRYVLGGNEGHLRVPGLADPHAELSVRGEQILLQALDGPLHHKRRAVAAVALDPGVRAWLGSVEIWVDAPRLEPAGGPDADSVTAPRGPSSRPPAGHQQVQPSPSSPARRSEPGRSVPPSARAAAHLTPPGPTAPRSGAKHPDDEDYDDELDFVVPFDLAAQLRGLPHSPKVSKGICAASVLQFEAGRVRDLGLVRAGEAERVAPGGPGVSCNGELVAVTWPDEAHDVHGGSPAQTHGMVVLRRGEATVGTIGARQWRITAIKPAGTPLMVNLPRAAGAGLLFGVSFVMSLMGHGFLGLGVETMAVIEPAPPAEEAAEEQFAEVEMRLEEPPEVVQQRETLQLSEKAPTVSRQQVTQASEMPRSENTSVSSLLSRLAASEASAAGLTEGISNIDAVAAAESTNTAFNLAGRLAATSGVKVGRSGTGAVNTSGQVGDGVGKLNGGRSQGSPRPSHQALVAHEGARHPRASRGHPRGQLPHGRDPGLLRAPDDEEARPRRADSVRVDHRDQRHGAGRARAELHDAERHRRQLCQR